MARRLSIGVNWQGEFEREMVFERVQVADEVGVDCCFVAEAWGRDAFTLLTQLAERTKRIKLATGIVNYYSRSPAALAQHFATLDELSGGRMIIGLGASSANVIEHFHGISFTPPLARILHFPQNFLSNSHCLLYIVRIQIRKPALKQRVDCAITQH